MKPYDYLEPGRSYAFEVLFDAVCLEPHNIPKLVAADRQLLRATNWIGENVLHWFAVENGIEEIALLRSLGSPIPQWALVEAMEMGHCETVILLLELGAEVDIGACRTSFASNPFEVSSRKRRLIRSYFQQFSYSLDTESTDKPLRRSPAPPPRAIPSLWRKPKPHARRPSRRKQPRRAGNLKYLALHDFHG
jgi:hypothetical protein